MDRTDLNGRFPVPGDIINRKNVSHLTYEMVTGYTGSGNIRVSQICWNVNMGFTLVDNGYITFTNYVIIDTPKVADEKLQFINSERTKRGLDPLKSGNERSAG